MDMAFLFNFFSQVILFGGIMLILLETGRRVGKRAMIRDPEHSHQGLGPVEAAVFGLMGLIIALTFSGAANRFDQRRMYIVDEANAIGTAYLRVDLLPAEDQPQVRKLFREYLDTRIAVYQDIFNKEKVEQLLNKTNFLQQQIWKASVSASEKTGSTTAGMLLLPALNSMFDICSTRTAIRKIHQPDIIFVVMILLALVCALIAGFGMSVRKSRSWIHLTGFILVMIITIVVIIDLEYPRVGFIRIDQIDELLVNMRSLVK